MAVTARHRRPAESHRPSTPTRWWRNALAILTAMLLGISGAVGMSTAATAAVDGINVDVLHNGQPVEDGQTITTGEPIQVRVSYDAVLPIDGETIQLSLPEGIDLDGALPSNQAIESIADNGDGTYTVTFKDPIPADVTEGAFVFNLRASSETPDDGAPISWQLGGEEEGITLVVEDEEVPPVEIGEGYQKRVSPGDLNRYVQVEQDENGDYQFVGLDPAIAEQALTYTLVIDSAEAREDGYTVEDQLPAGLGYVDGSFDAVLKVYNPEETESPIAFAPTVSGNGFSGTLDGIPADSRVTITYQATVNDIALLEGQLRESFEALDGAPGGFAAELLRNSATFGGGNERTADVALRGNVPGVGVGANFGKWGNWGEQSVVVDENGVLEEPAVMDYTLRADLSPWDERNENFTLTRNVVISDTLIDQAEWLSDDTDFITVTSKTGEGLQTLTEAADCPSVADFAGDEYVGQFCVDGQTLLINVGKDNTTYVDIVAKAQLTTVEGLNGSGDTTIVGGTAYPWDNRASFHYRDGDPANRDASSKVVELPDDYEEGLNDSAAFDKTSNSDEVRVSPGESAEVGYTFDIDTARAGADPTKSRIVDEVDTEVFDLSDLSAVRVDGRYGNTGLAHEDFVLSTDDDGNLVIELSESGDHKVNAAGEGQQWTVNIVLTTIPFDGKETFEIYNRATLSGEDGGQEYWSEDEAEATSFGDEAEMRKRLFDEETGEWTQNIDAPIEDGQFVNDTFVYSIELIPRGNYGAAFPVQIFTREDVLPETLDFLGFTELDENGVPGEDLSDEILVGMNGNVQARYADGVVMIEQVPGTSLNPNEKIVTYFMVRANDASGEIVNSIAGSDATITPVGDPSVDIEKWNDEGAAPEYDETGALTDDGFDGDFDEADGPVKELRAGEELPINFTVSNDGREPLADVVVGDELTDGKGVIEDLVCVFPDGSEGTTWGGPFEIATQFDCTGILPALTGGDTHANLSTVVGTGVHSGAEVDDQDPWHARVAKPSIDIEKWTDEGAAPEYDETGALTNDGFDGDFDEKPGKELTADRAEEINLTVSNDGAEPLIDIVVSDELTDGKGVIEDLVCVFPDGSEGTEWSGPLEVGEQFDCTGTLPGLSEKDIHSDTATVAAVGLHSGLGTDDADEWHGFVPEERQGGLAVTGVQVGGLLVVAILLLGGGGLFLLARRRRVS